MLLHPFMEAAPLMISYFCHPLTVNVLLGNVILFCIVENVPPPRSRATPSLLQQPFQNTRCLIGYSCVSTVFSGPLQEQLTLLTRKCDRLWPFLFPKGKFIDMPKVFLGFTDCISTTIGHLTFIDYQLHVIHWLAFPTLFLYLILTVLHTGHNWELLFPIFWSGLSRWFYLPCSGREYLYTFETEKMGHSWTKRSKNQNQKSVSTRE